MPPSRAWLLIEHAGPWGRSAVETELPAPLAALASEADRAGIRVQLIRRPRGSAAAPSDGPAMFTAWTHGPAPWVRRVDRPVKSESDLDSAALAAGVPPVT